jgi:hypothetical protein
MTDEEMDGWAEAIEAAERCQRAEDSIRGEQEIEIAEQIAAGLLCLVCGSPLTVQQHRPARCTDCGGSVSATPWFVAGQYFSDPAAAHAARQQFIAKRDRLVAELRRVEGIAHQLGHSA